MLPSLRSRGVGVARVADLNYRSVQGKYGTPSHLRAAWVACRVGSTETSESAGSSVRGFRCTAAGLAIDQVHDKICQTHFGRVRYSNIGEARAREHGANDNLVESRQSHDYLRSSLLS